MTGRESHTITPVVEIPPPETGAALLLIGSVRRRERFERLLREAGLEWVVAHDAAEARSLLSSSQSVRVAFIANEPDVGSLLEFLSTAVPDPPAVIAVGPGNWPSPPILALLDDASSDEDIVAIARRFVTER